MKAVRTYIAEFNPAIERLEALIERVQADAYAAGARDAAGKMFEIAVETKQRTDKRVRDVLNH